MGPRSPGRSSQLAVCFWVRRKLNSQVLSLLMMTIEALRLDKKDCYRMVLIRRPHESDAVLGAIQSKPRQGVAMHVSIFDSNHMSIYTANEGGPPAPAKVLPRPE